MPAALLPWVKPQFCDAEGNPVYSGKLYSFIAGTTTPQPTYSDPDLAAEHANANPTLLNAAGEAATNLYLLPTGYTFRLDDADDVTLWTVDGVEDVGAIAAATFGRGLTAGGKNVTSGYTALATDQLITVASTGGANPCVINLLPAADASLALAIKNLGTIALSVVPNGSDTLDAVNAAFTVPAASGATKPTVWLAPDGVSAWHILASHGL
jgi:hypothetical protein